MITEAQRTARAGMIGSSDAAAVLGLDPYRSAADIYLEKTGQIEPFEGNEATERGNLLERPVLEWAQLQIDKTFITDRTFKHPSGLIVANIDAYVPGDEVREIVEAKTTVDPEGWGDEGTDQVPERVLAQVHHQFACVPTARIAYVPVLMPGFRSFDFRLYKVQRNDELAAMVERSGIDFMERHVLPKIPPDDYRPSLEVLKRVRRVPSKTVPVADDLVARYLAAKEQKKAADDDCLKAHSYLLAALGDAEAGTYGGGSLTYLESKRAGYSVEPTTYRQLHVKPNKKGAE